MEKKEIIYAVFVLGLKWRDRVNGNTYTRPIVFLNNGDHITTDRYEYGYGTYYRTMAEKLCNDRGILYGYEADHNFADKYVTKNELKNAWY